MTKVEVEKLSPHGGFLKRSSKRRNLKTPIGKRSENGAFRKL